MLYLNCISNSKTDKSTGLLWFVIFKFVNNTGEFSLVKTGFYRSLKNRTKN